MTINNQSWDANGNGKSANAKIAKMLRIVGSAGSGTGPAGALLLRGGGRNNLIRFLHFRLGHFSTQ